MNIEIERQDSNCIIKIEGKLDTNSAQELSDVIDKALEKYDDIILDMERMEYITSAGIRVILKTDMALRNCGSLSLINVSDEIAHVFSLAHFDTYLNIKGNADAETTQDTVETQNYHFEPSVLNRKQREALPPMIRLMLDAPGVQLYELDDEEDKALSIVALILDEEKKAINVMYLDICGEDWEHILVATINQIVDHFASLKISKVSFSLKENDELKDKMVKLCQNFDIESRGVEKSYITYSMEQIKNSKLLENISQLKPKMSNIYNLSNINTSTLFLLQFSDTVNMDELDPVFCRIYVRDNNVAGLLDAVQLDDENVVLKSITFADGVDNSNVLVLLFASFSEFLTEIMDDTAKLTISIDKKSLVNGFVKILGNPEKIENYYRYEKEL